MRRVLVQGMGKRVVASDFLNFSATIAQATIGNSHHQLDGPALKRILGPAKNAPDFIEKTFGGIFYQREDLRFLDRISHNIEKLHFPEQQALARAALMRSCLKKQPRGVFTITGNRYDGWRDLKLSIEEHFLEQVEKFNRVVFDNGRRHTVKRADVFDLRPRNVDLIYLDPPCVPRSDDNCYIKRYHFLEGLAVYWRGRAIMENTRTKKLAKRFTPFSYKHTVVDALRRTFKQFQDSVIVLSYSSNAVPDVGTIEALLREVKDNVEVRLTDHTYTFGTHSAAQRRAVSEYLFIGR
jgi:adenine-specific DNA-methyltransferase